MVFAFIIANVAWFIIFTVSNKRWYKLCNDQNKEWSEHCVELIDNFYREEMDEQNS